MIIESGVATAKRAFPRKKRRQLVIAVGAVVLFLLTAGLAAHDVIERVVLERTLSSAIGGDVAIAGFHRSDGVTTLTSVHAKTNDGAIVVDADEIAYRVRDGRLRVRPRGVRALVTLDRLHAGDTDGAKNIASVLGPGTMTVHVVNAGAKIERAPDAPAPIEIAGITGDATLGGRDTRYVLNFFVAGPTGASDATARASSAGGRTTHTLTASALPLDVLATLLPPSDVAIHSGTARDVTISAGETITAKMTLDQTSVTIAGHDVHELSGPIVITSDGIGSPKLDGLVDGGIPLGFSGEVHDVRDWGTALTAGTRDLRALGRLLSTIASQPRVRWMNLETTAPGIAYGQYAMTMIDAKTSAEIPHVVQLITMDPTEATLRIDTALADDRIISRGERTSDLGIRTKAVVGVNGDYFDIGHTYEPQGMLMRSGVLLHGPTDHEAVVFDRQNRPTFAVYHLHGRIVNGSRTYPITQINSWPLREATIVTPAYGKTLPAAPGVTLATLTPLGGTRYRVRRIVKGNAPIPVDFEIGVGFGPSIVGPLPKPGAVLDISYVLDPAVPDAVAAIGSGPLLLKDGAWFEDKHAPAPDERDVRWPVIAVGLFADKTLVFAAVDGRHPERSIGMTRPEFAELLRGFGVVDAMALDSGGSVTMVARSPGNSAVTLHSAPSDDSQERYVSDALFVYSSAPRSTIVTAPRPHVEPTPGVPPVATLLVTPVPVTARR